MKTITIKKIAVVILVMASLSLANLGRAQTVIYSDNFNIPDTASLDGSTQTGRHTGLLANSVVGRSGGVQLTITSSNLNVLRASATADGRMRFCDTNGAGGVLTSGRHDWASTDFGAGIQITNDSGMEISFDWTAADNTQTAWISYSVGIAPVTDTANRYNNSGTDSGIRLQNNGVSQVYQNGASGVTNSFDVTSLRRHVDLFYFFKSWADGSPVVLAAYVNGVLVAGQNFAWNGNGGVQNMEISSLATGTAISNFMVTSISSTPAFVAANPTADSPPTNYMGHQVTISAAIGGSAPILYQWKVDKGSGFTNVTASATNTTLTLTDTQISDSGAYALFATNSAGNTSTASMPLTFINPPANATNLINIQFTGETPGAGASAVATQTGGAVIGGTGDVWNPVFTLAGSYTAGTGLTCTNAAPIYLKNAANIGTPNTLTFVADYIHNGGVGTFAASPDASLMTGLLGMQSARTGTVTVSNLAKGDYDLYLYGVNAGAQGRSCTFNANGVAAVCGPNNSVNTLVAPTNYVHLVPTVTSNGVLTITMTGAATGDAQLNGLQLIGPQAAPTLTLGADTTITPASVYAGYPQITLSAGFVGTLPITNQWMVNTGAGFAPIIGATNTTLVLTNLNVANSGSYALFASNRAGTSNSTPAVLTVLATPANTSLNVQFTGSWLGSGNAPTQIGGAVIGGGSDVWNTINNPTGGTSPAGLAKGTNLTLVDVGSVGITVTLDYVGDYVFNGTAFGYSNPFASVASSYANLMSGYMGSVSQGGSADTNTITLHNLAPGYYDLYMYVCGRTDGQTRVDVLSANGQSAICGPNNGTYYLSPGVNYVHLTPTVTTNGLLNISYYGTADAGQALLNGFQLSGPSTNYVAPFIITDTTCDSPSTDYAGRTVAFTASFGGNPTPGLQWKVDKGSGYVNVPKATNSTLTLTSVQTTNTGNYALFATNLVGALNSTPLSLNVVSLPSTMAVNVQFWGTSRGSGFADAQVGPAVIGNDGDLWNLVSNPNPVAGDTNPISGSLQGLADATDIGTSISLSYTGNTILNSGAGTPFSGSGSPAANLMEACLGADNTNTATVTLQGLQAGTYDLYLYSSAGNTLQNEISTFTANSWIATVGPNGSNNVMTLGTNYVHLTPTVTGSGVLNISFVGKVNGQASLNGLQLSGPGAVPLRPLAGFTGAPTNLFAGQSVVFTDASMGNITDWLWSFGDGNAVTNGSNANETHAYSAAGIYTVSLTVIGANGSDTNTQVGYIVVNPTPVFGKPVLSGGEMILNGTDGTAGVQYRILSSTDVALPTASWIPVWTNVFAPDGSYSFTNSPLTGGANFFILVSP